jgi:stage II sporulation protein AB (anti-sigma F factor)
MPETKPKSEPPARTADEPWDWVLRIANRLELTKPVRDLVASCCEMHGVDEEARQELLLVVSEIVNNSIEHVVGRGPGGYHEVEIGFRVRDGVIEARVRDEGEGGVAQSDFDGAAQPTLESDRGRGLLLIKVYVDDIQVRTLPGVGTEIRIRKSFGQAKGDEA